MSDNGFMPASSPPPPYGQPTSSPPPPYGRSASSMPPPPPPAAPGRRTPLAVVLLVVGLVALVAGQAVGATAANRVTIPADVSGPPQIPEDFPDERQRYLAGVTVPQVTEDWLGRDGLWTCEDGPVDPLDSAHEVHCTPSDEDVSWAFRVVVSYDGEDQVSALSAQCGLGPETKACSRHFRNLCDVVFSDDPGTAKKAKKWIRENMESDRPAVFGDVHISMPLEGDTASISIRPAA